MVVDIVKVAKCGLKLAAGAGTASIVRGIVLNNVSPRNKWDRISIGVGCFVIGDMLASAVDQHLDKLVDKFVEDVAVIIQTSQEAIKAISDETKEQEAEGV